MRNSDRSLVIVRCILISAGILVLLIVSFKTYSEISGPVSVPLPIVYSLAGWESHSETTWNGKGTIITFTSEDDLVPLGDHVTRKEPFHSKILNGDRAMLVYLPENYTNAGKPYPVIFALHGFGDRPNNYVISLLPLIEELMEDGSFPPSVVVMPDFSLTGNGKTPQNYPTDGRSGSWYINSNMGRYADHFINEIVPFVRKNFNVSRRSNYTALMGNSMGGFGVLYYSITRPNLADTVAAVYPAADLRYSIRGSRLKKWDADGYLPITTDDPTRPYMEHRVFFNLAVPEAFFFEPVFNSDKRPGDTWEKDLPVWKRMKEVNPVDLLRDKDVQLDGIEYYVFAGDVDAFYFDAHIPLLRELLLKSGARVYPDDNIVPGLEHGWWQKHNDETKRKLVRWIGSRLMKK